MLTVRSLAYPVIVLILLALGWSWYGADTWRLSLALIFYSVFVALPGYLCASALLERSTWLERLIVGTIAAEVILGIALKLTRGSLFAGFAMPALALASFTKKITDDNTPAPALLQPALVALTVIGLLTLFLYGQAYNAGANYTLHYNPTVDLTYFQTVLTSIGNYGEFKDLAHLGVHFNYPDLGYRLLSFVHTLSGAEAFDILFFFAPLKDYLLLSLSLYCLVSCFASPWIAFLAAISFYVFGSRSMLELNVLMTNPAYREGLYILLMGLWAYTQLDRLPRTLFFTIAIVGLVLVKPAIWLVAAPALGVTAVISAVRAKSWKSLSLTAVVLGISAIIFYLSFAPGKSGLSGGHYEIIFGQGLANTIDSMSKIGLAGLFRDVVTPLSGITFWSILAGLLLFVPYLIQQMRHSGRFILLPFVFWTRRKLLREIDLQLVGIVVICFAYLAFMGMEYTSFLHVYLVPLAITAATIYLAANGTWRIQWAGWKGKFATIAVILLLAYDFSFAIYGYYQERVKTASVEIPSKLIDEFRQVRELTDTSSVLATYRTGLFQHADERSYLAAAFTERKILSEGAIYGSLIMGYHENVREGHSSPTADTLRVRRAVRDSIFFSSSSDVVRQSAVRYGVTHILIQHRANNKGDEERIHAAVGDTIFHGEMLTLLKL